MELTKVAKVLMVKDDGVDFKNKQVDDLDEHIEGQLLKSYFTLTTPCAYLAVKIILKNEAEICS